MLEFFSAQYWRTRRENLAAGEALLEECAGLQKHHVKRLYKYFYKADADHSTWISVMEFLMFFDIERTVFAVKAFTHMDTDGNDRIDFPEFVRATWAFVSLSKEGLRHFAFALYDLDGSGSIERFEVEAMARHRAVSMSSARAEGRPSRSSSSSTTIRSLSS